MNSHKGECRTIVYIHGIGDQHPEGELKFQWDKALLDFDAGERTRMAYWARSSDVKTPPLTARVPKSFRTLARGGPAGTEPYSDFLALCVSELTDDPAEAESLVTMGHGFLASQSMKSGVVRFPNDSRRTRAFDWIPDDITRAFLWLFLRDVHGYLHVPERREEMKRSLLERILPGGGPFVVIGHSLGSVIAYDVLRSLEGQDVSVPLFVTLGSPIGMGPITRYLMDSGGPLKRPVCVRQWLNVSDPLDVVAADHQLKDNLGNDASVKDITENIKGGIHLALPYLRHPPVREAVTAETDTALFQFVAPVAIVRNLSRLLEGAGRSDRVPVLIELSEDSNMPGVDLEERRTYTLKAIAEVTRKDLEDPELNLRRLVRFVAADLTRFEAERLASLIPLHPEKPSGAPLHRLWHNSVKNALLRKSAETVHAGPAHRTYRAEGAEIHWAVLDTGCDRGHPHFATHSTIEEEIDCTGRIPVRGPGRAQDRNGHGTHVAGIIAGEWKNGVSEVRAMAPRTRLHIYKVLRDDGRGDDASIIMALDDIAAQNEKHGGLRVHGVNLSLGGRFEPSIFGCGFSPLCAELRRLWMGGVLIVLAAGNEGYLSIEWQDATIEANMPISIGDPANLEEAIAVGSTHRERPHLYGTSFFSSRGPTADGRQKPDLVAPGEKIASCRAGGRGTIDSDLYVQMSGTSMAAPHVSGLLAAFLSARPEFKGYPERVKKTLLDNCTDLGRVKEHQGAGLPNLVRMLLNT